MVRGPKGLPLTGTHPHHLPFLSFISTRLPVLGQNHAGAAVLREKSTVKMPGAWRPKANGEEASGHSGEATQLPARPLVGCVVFWLLAWLWT